MKSGKALWQSWKQATREDTKKAEEDEWSIEKEKVLEADSDDEACKKFLLHCKNLIHTDFSWKQDIFENLNKSQESTQSRLMVNAC